MIVKLNPTQFEYLQRTLANERKDLFQHLSNGRDAAVVIDDEIALEIRDWVGEMLQKTGFNENYELNSEGRILEQLEDLLYT